MSGFLGRGRVAEMMWQYALSLVLLLGAVSAVLMAARFRIGAYGVAASFAYLLGFWLACLVQLRGDSYVAGLVLVAVSPLALISRRPENPA